MEKSTRNYLTILKHVTRSVARCTWIVPQPILTMARRVDIRNRRELRVLAARIDKKRY